MLYVIEGLNRFRGSIVTSAPYHYEKPLHECSRDELYKRLCVSDDFDDVIDSSIKGIEFEEIDQYNLDRSQQDEISIIVYYLNGSEIRARVNQFYSQLMNTSKDRLESIIDTEKCIEPRQKVIEVVNHFDDILQLGRVKKVILSYYENRLKKDDDLSKIDSDFFLYKLGYYCKKQGVFRIKTIEMSVLSRDEFVKSENRDKYVISSLNSLINLVEYATRLAATVAYDRLHEIGLC